MFVRWVRLFQFIGGHLVVSGSLPAEKICDPCNRRLRLDPTPLRFPRFREFDVRCASPACGDLVAELAEVLRQNDGVDHVDHSVAGCNIRLGDVCVVYGYVTVFDHDRNALSIQRLRF